LNLPRRFHGYYTSPIMTRPSALPTPRVALIAGAGIGGLAAAIALRRQGWTVHLFERASTPRELGYDLMLASNAVAALDELGVTGAVMGQAVRIHTVSARANVAGRVRRADLAVVPTHLRPLVVSRQVLHGALLAAVGPETVIFDATADDVQDETDGVTLQLRDGRTYSGDVVVAADGGGSLIRRRFHPAPQQGSQRLMAARGVAFGCLSPTDVDLALAMAPGGDSGVIRGARDAVYWFVTSRTSADAPVPRDDWATTRAADFGEPLHSIVRATRPADIRTEILVDDDPLDTWGTGRVTLLGDAAHPMLPHAGQGAAQALEDAVALGLALRGPLEPAAALRRYEHARMRRSAKFVRLSRRLCAIRSSQHPVVSALRTAVISTAPVGLLRLARWYRPSDPHASLRSPWAKSPE
jgi:2-polyprenyl-6-methoxyphenol hydroxylase-like FAD-dependent oxidoreductase